MRSSKPAAPPRVVVSGRRVLIRGKLASAWLALENERIVAAGTGRPPAAEVQIDAGNDVVGPAFVDTHVHGYGGFDASDCGDPEQGESTLRGMARSLFDAGVGAFCPTLYPLPPAATIGCLRTIGQVMGRRARGEAEIAGAHLEGPFVNPERAGALDPRAIRAPDVALLESFLDTGAVSIVTLAPEMKGAEKLVRACVRAGVVVSMGHSSASLAVCRKARSLGAGSITHLFNAMSPFHHRDASILHFALTEPGFPTELIGDLVHVGAPTIDLVLRARGLDGLRLVSDNLSAAGTRRKAFRAGNYNLTVKNEVAYRSGGGIAGSCKSMASSVRGLVRSGLLTIEDAWRLASVEPLRVARPASLRGFARVRFDPGG